MGTRASRTGSVGIRLPVGVGGRATILPMRALRLAVSTWMLCIPAAGWTALAAGEPHLSVRVHDGLVDASVVRQPITAVLHELERSTGARIVGSIPACEVSLELSNVAVSDALARVLSGVSFVATMRRHGLVRVDILRTQPPAVSAAEPTPTPSDPSRSTLVGRSTSPSVVATRARLRPGARRSLRNARRIAALAVRASTRLSRASVDEVEDATKPIPGDVRDAILERLAGIDVDDARVTSLIQTLTANAGNATAEAVDP